MHEEGNAGHDAPPRPASTRAAAGPSCSARASPPTSRPSPSASRFSTTRAKRQYRRELAGRKRHGRADRDAGQRGQARGRDPPVLPGQVDRLGHRCGDGRDAGRHAVRQGLPGHRLDRGALQRTAEILPAPARLEAGSDRTTAAGVSRRSRLRVRGRSVRRAGDAFRADGLARRADRRLQYPSLRPADGHTLFRRHTRPRPARKRDRRR